MTLPPRDDDYPDDNGVLAPRKIRKCFIRVDPRDPMDAHRRLPPRWIWRRSSRNGDTGGPTRLHDPLPQVYWQIPEQEAIHVSPGSSVVVELQVYRETRIRAADR